MKTAEQIQNDIEELPQAEYMKLVHWFTEHDWNAWDEQIEKDVASGKLDFLIDEALEEKAEGRLRNL